MRQGSLYIISAPSGAGKTSLVKALLAQDTQISLSISHTTRAPRPGEQDGVDYFFVSREDFQRQVDANAFLEHAQVFDNFYGTSEQAIYAQLDQGQDVIVEIDWQGAQQVRERMGENCSIFIIPPSLAALEQRLQSRGQDSADIIARRMRDARNETSHYDEYDYLIVNDDFDQALAELQAVFQAERLRLNKQMKVHQALLQDLLASGTD